MEHLLIDMDIVIRYAIARRAKPAIKIIYITYITVITRTHANMAKLIYRLARVAIRHGILDVNSIRYLLITFSKTPK